VTEYLRWVKFYLLYIMKRSYPTRRGSSYSDVERMRLSVLVGRQEAGLVEWDPVSDSLDIFFTSDPQLPS
jgi:hypothetical protein